MLTCRVDGCVKPAKNQRQGGLCGMHGMRLRRHGHLDVTRKYGSIDDFYEPGDPAACWEWRGSLNGYGYGRYGRQGMAHRLVFEARRGPVPTGMVLDHLCRNTACVNPAHLEPVAQGENIERGLNGYPLRTLCRNGLHDITTPSAWYVSSQGSRTCLECKRANDRRAEAKRGKRTRE